jgi:membrane protease YdiL (CAAX protease family)
MNMGSQRGGRATELAVVFGLGPAALALAPRWMLTIGILGAAAACGVVLWRDPTFPRGDFTGMAGARRGLRPVLARTLLLGAALLAGAALFSARPLLVRAHPALWAAIMILYPISAYAQELVCRTFFFHRYGHLFERPAARVLASAVVFGWAHIAVNNLLAVLLATAAGLVFASTYERWRSTLLVGVEHALYGDLAFSAGLGSLFYASARWFKLGGP